MKKMYVFIILFIRTFSYAQTTLVITLDAKIVLAPHAKMVVQGNIMNEGLVTLRDSAKVSIASGVLDAIRGCDSTSRFFILEGCATLERNINQLGQYVFPIGYAPRNDAYRGFTLDMKSLGVTGSGMVAVRLVPNISGTINYERYFPSNPSCVSGTAVALNCLSSDGWHCDGPNDYEYVASAVTSNTCSGSMRRIIRTGTGTNAWQDSVESVVGDLADNLCNYSDWLGTGDYVVGGTYRNFSDFAIASSLSTLPVTLVDLRADALNRKLIRVSWRTVTELNNDRFIVGRSIDGVGFTVIGEVQGSGTTSMMHQYFFDDEQVLPNTVYYYQLEQVDYDGAIHRSSIVSAKISDAVPIEMGCFNVLGQRVSKSNQGSMWIK